MANSEQYKIILQIDGKDNASASIDATNKKVKELSDSAEKGSQQARSFGQAWDGFKEHATSFLGAAAAVTALGAAIYGMGRASQAAEITFEQVSGSAENAAASLARMRALTGGVIDDMALMQGANSLLVTGIAQTNEQAEELVNLGARLGAVMGVDATESIENLNSALLNNSFMRLDTLGISAARVRERVNELKEAGMDMSAAFSQAVVEIGGQTLDDLGAAAGVAETAIGRLTTKFQNLIAELAEGGADWIEKAAISLEQLGTLASMELDAANSWLRGGNTVSPERQAEISGAAGEWQDAPANAEIVIGVTLENPEFANAVASGEFADEILSGETMTRELEIRYDLAEGSLDFFSLGGAGELPGFDMLAGDISPDVRIQADDIEAVSQRLDILETNYQEAAVALESYHEKVKQANAATEEQQRLMAEAASADEFLYATTAVITNLTEIETQSQRLSSIFEQGAFSTSSGSMTFFDAEELDEVQAQTEEIVSEYERLKQVAEDSDYTLVSEEEVERARAIAAQAEDTAADAERFATAFERASLAQLGGATDGGRLNEFYQGVLANIEDPELRAQAEQMFNLNSGVETAETQIIEYGEALVAAITEEFGVAAGMRAGEDFTRAFEEGIALGLSGEALQDYVEAEVGYALEGSATGTGVGGGSTEIVVQPGEGYIALAERTGYTREELEAATGGGMLMAGQVITMSDGTTLIALDEQDVPQTLQESGNSVLNTIHDGEDEAAAAQESGTYTYYDTSTQSVVTVGAPAAQEPMVTEEEAEATSEMADDFLQAETSVNNIAAADTSTTLDPLVTDLESANAELTTFEESMERVTSAAWAIEMPITFIFDNTTAELLSRNSSVVETIRLVLPQLGVTPS